ncbi:hypothetical protein cyc_05476 [Cyclospora cayetanensis]|uniref:Uncharacterized protein n=1 Tax=Cyclospora cayetanensis TaxID=88456 RepID=A0A1D3DB54_9EIME|nr:hypothetical protein cyc_05476 [Cyclospora cayetanensis]
MGKGVGGEAPQARQVQRALTGRNAQGRRVARETGATPLREAVQEEARNARGGATLRVTRKYEAKKTRLRASTLDGSTGEVRRQGHSEKAVAKDRHITDVAVKPPKEVDMKYFDLS